MVAKSQHDEFMELVSLHQVALYGYIYAIAQNADDADDVLQRTLMTLWRRFDEFEPGTDFARWAWKTAKFEVLNYNRGKRRQRVTFSDTLVTALAEQSHLADEPDDVVQRNALNLCLSRLNEKDKHLIQLCYEKDQAIKVVAAQQGRTSQSICNSLKRIRTALYNCIQKKLGAEGGQS